MKDNNAVSDRHIARILDLKAAGNERIIENDIRFEEEKKMARELRKNIENLKKI